jgi:hypothetical protein
MLGAAAAGAAWPVGVVFLLYCMLAPRSGTTPERTSRRAPVL